MSWFAPKVLKSEYDKVVADNMELQFLIEELEVELKNYRLISKTKSNIKDIPKKIDVKERWVAEFSPQFFVNRLLDYIFESEDVHYDKRKRFFLNKKTDKVVAEWESNGLLIRNSEVLKIYKKLSNRNELKRMPRGSLYHLYNDGLVIAGRRSQDSSVRFSINFTCDTKINGLLINENTLADYKNVFKED